jgi:protein-tyrosine phosphatase
MIKKALPVLVLLAVFHSCAKEKPDVRAACELTSAGTYLIKWEIYPPLNGTVQIYESARPDSFNLKSPITEQDISTGYKNVLSMPSAARTYFKLVFNKKYSIVTTTRTVPMQQIFNFRDMGGYSNRNRKQSRWGKLYRSGSLALPSKDDIQTLNQLGIKTIIDLRTERDDYFHPLKFQPERIFNLPLRGNSYNAFFDKILSGTWRRVDAFVYSQDIFSFLIENNADHFSKMFDILLDEDNYPIVFFCSLGKDRSAIAAALILTALDIDREIILNDYLLSNDLIDYYSLVKNIGSFTLQVEETIMALYGSNREYLTYALDRIEKDYGSVLNYLEKELKLSNKKREKLKEILLYE